MALRALPRRRLHLAALLVAFTLSGCNRGDVPDGDAPAAQPAETAAPGDSSPKPPALDPRLTQSFEDATRKDPPADWPRPPDLTATGKSVGKLYTDVVRLWKEVPFANAAGKPIAYAASVETDQGVIEIALRPEVAPNHVRNFVALARAGYYDGLAFERIVHQESDVEKGVQLDLIEGGGPLGVADPGYDGIGYWLKPEFDDRNSPKAPHEEGAVGACRGGEEEDTAACKFYIIVGKAPASLNGNYTVFGKVTKGLDVARKIHQQPVIEDENDGGYHRPEKPVLIRKVAIHTREVDN
jgi:peptidyl-prolyl cis-trans isomerase B (cyclophilin B)